MTGSATVVANRGVSVPPPRRMPSQRPFPLQSTNGIAELIRADVRLVDVRLLEREPPRPVDRRDDQRFWAVGRVVTHGAERRWRDALDRRARSERRLRERSRRRGGSGDRLQVTDQQHRSYRRDDDSSVTHHSTPARSTRIGPSLTWCDRDRCTQGSNCCGVFAAFAVRRFVGAPASSARTGGIATNPITSCQPSTDPIASRETPAQHARTSFRHPQASRLVNLPNDRRGFTSPASNRSYETYGAMRSEEVHDLTALRSHTTSRALTSKPISGLHLA